jgi:hypothetical protein
LFRRDYTETKRKHTMKEVAFTEKTLKEFEIACKKALDAQHNTFIFEGNEYLPAYAKYMIEYLKTKQNA